MARYRSHSFGRRRDRTRSWIYTISTLLIIAAVIFVIYRYRSNPPGESEPSGTSTDVGAAKEEKPTEIVLPDALSEPNLPETTELIGEPNAQIAGQIDKAMALLNAKPAKIIEARDILNEVLPMCSSGQQREFVKEQLSKLADEWLFSRKIFPADSLCGTHKVQKGELLGEIGKQFKVPWEMLQEINNIPRPEALPAGDVIKVIHGPFHAKIYRSTFTMDVYLQNTYVRSFQVGLGQAGMETPTGLWRVKSDGKLIEPPWPDPDTGKILYPGDPNYALGSRWIGLDGIEGQAKDRTGFGIHGTKEPETLGTASSRGCIRLDNGNAILLYNLLVPTHSLVKIEE